MLNGLERPVGRVRIRKTRMAGAGDVLVADLAGASKASVACVKMKRKYYVIGPRSLGGVQEVPADSLTDALHSHVEALGQAVGRPKANKPSRRKKK